MKVSMAIFLACLAILASQAAWAHDIAPIVTTAGALRCSDEQGGLACRGIGYAVPPVDKLRFRPPLPAPVREGVRDATHDREACIQPETAYDPAQGSEDCLYLNVYRSRQVAGEGAVPVIVWLHGGGFMNGSGNAFDGMTLSRTAHAILVTVNYRLGPFGWLALPALAKETPDGTTGNYGLLDTLAALRWVHANIAAFGGDPARVTLAGQSAGGEQVLALMASDNSTGLFSRAIAMSAPARLNLPDVDQAASRSAGLLQAAGCTDPTTQVECLRRIDAHRLLAAAHESWNLLAVPGFLQWTPTIDGAVLKQQWLARYEAGSIQHVPIMIGHTGDEFSLFTAIYENGQHAPISDRDADDKIGGIFKAAAPQVRAAYPAEAFPTAKARFDRLGTDAFFAAGETADRAALARHVPVFAYEFDDPQAPESHVHARYEPIGSGHDSDLALLFQWDDFSRRRPVLTPDQDRLARTMGRYWGRFAATGNPNGPGLPAWVPTHGDDHVQLLRPETLGGVQSSPAGAYAEHHHLPFWQSLQAK